MKLEILPDIPPAEQVIFRIADEINALPADSHITVLTGAGISRESGIPDFRSEDGLWRRYNMERVATLKGFRENPAEFWSLFDELSPLFDAAQPSRVHQALLALERKRGLTVLTQNIDGLHQKAGSSDVVEIYGSPHTFVCLECAERYPFHYDPHIQLAESPPQCTRNGCRGLLKPDIVFFGQTLGLGKRIKITQILNTTDVLIALGTSFSVNHTQEMANTVMQRGSVYVFNVLPMLSGYDGQVVGDAQVTFPQLVDRIT